MATFNCSLHLTTGFLSIHSPSHLQFLHGNNVRGLHKVLKLGNLVLELIQRHLLVLNNQVDLQLLDTETDRHPLGGTPDQAILLDADNSRLQSLQIRLVVCIITSLADIILIYIRDE